MSAIKLVVMGSGGVGKSAMTCRYTQGAWVEKYDPTIEDSYTKTVELDGKALQLEILDTAGQEEYSVLRETFIHTGNGFLFVYSITDDSTFEELTNIREQVLRSHPNPYVPMVLVGNKVDLEEERAVSEEEGRLLAEQFGNIPFFEISAKRDVGVSDSFAAVLRAIVSRDTQAGRGTGAGSVMGADLPGDNGGQLGSSQSGTDGVDSTTGKKKKKKYAKGFKKKCIIL